MELLFSLGNLFSFLNYGGVGSLIGCLVLIIVVLVGLNFSGRFKTAIDELVDANPTSISNPVVFTVFGVLTFLAVVVATLGQLVAYFSMFQYGFGMWVLTDLIRIVLVAMLGFAIAGLYFQPERANVKIDKSSSVAEDVIALLSFGLKVPLCFAAMFSNALIVLGVITILAGLGDYFTASGWGNPAMGVSSGIGVFLLGAFAPFLFYLVFLFLFPIYNFWLAILHIPKIGKK